MKGKRIRRSVISCTQRREGFPPHASTPDEPRDGSRRKILVVDDEPGLRALVRATLEGPGQQILEAENGGEALALARREQPAIVLLDWMMPGASGIDVLAELRSDSRTAGTS